MTKNSKTGNETVSLQKAIAVLIGSTNRNKRKLSIVDINKYIKIAANKMGGISNVAEAIGISPKMLKQFTSIDALDKDVLDFVALRKIDSVDIVYHLSLLPKTDQYRVAQDVISGILNSNDVRAIKNEKRRFPLLEIADIIDKVLKSKDEIHYEIKIKNAGGNFPDCFKRELDKYVDYKSIISYDIADDIAVSLNATGKKKLQLQAKQSGRTLKQLISYLIKRSSLNADHPHKLDE